MLAGAGSVARADEVLYWMVDNPTIEPWYGTAAEYSETHPITDARIAAFKTSDTAAYQTSRAGGDAFGVGDHPLDEHSGAVFTDAGIFNAEYLPAQIRFQFIQQPVVYSDEEMVRKILA